jgi:hypothetical protein
MLPVLNAIPVLTAFGKAFARTADMGKTTTPPE